MGGIDQSVSPGIGGFLAFFLLAIALWLLMRNMNSRLRNVRYLEEAEDERRETEAQQEVVTRPPSPRPDGTDESVPEQEPSSRRD